MRIEIVQATQAATLALAQPRSILCPRRRNRILHYANGPGFISACGMTRSAKVGIDRTNPTETIQALQWDGIRSQEG